MTEDAAPAPTAVRPTGAAGAESTAAAAVGTGPAADQTTDRATDQVAEQVTDRAARPASPVDWRRLDPRMLLVHPLHELLRAAPALIALLVFGSTSGNQWWGYAGVVAVIAHGVSRWLTTTYRITPTQVRLRHGLLSRHERAVPLERIRTVDVTARALHRALGLARVEIGTGRSDRHQDDGFVLDAVTRTEADRLREELLHLRAPLRAAPAPATAPAGEPVRVRSGPPERVVPSVAVSAAEPRTRSDRPARPAVAVLARFDVRWLRFGPFLPAGLLLLLAGAGAVARIAGDARVNLDRAGPVDAVIGQLDGAGWALRVGEVAVVLLVLAAAFSTAAYALTYWGFGLTRHPEGTLRVERGLLTTRSVTIEERRLRGVELAEPVLVRAIGGARVVAIATGLRVGRGAERGGSLLLPPAPAGLAREVAGLVAGDADAVSGPLVPHGRAATRRRVTHAGLGALAVLAGLGALCGWAGLPVPVAGGLGAGTVAAAGLLALDRARSLGHAVTARYLVCRTGSLVRRRYVLRREGIIGWKIRASLFQRRAGVVTLTATTAGGRQGYRVLDVPAGQALDLAERAVPGLLAPFLRPGTARRP